MANTAEAFAFHIRLMAEEAAKRLADSAILSGTLASGGTDSAYLLELLALELLLKATLRIEGTTPPGSHNYAHLFSLLPQQVRDRIAFTASTRMGPQADFSQLHHLLDTWGRNFVSLRYPYEKYMGMTADQYHSRGQEWLQGGAVEENADFVYYPTELHGIVFALQNEVDTWLRKSAP